MLDHMGFAELWMLLSGIALVTLVLWLLNCLFPDFSHERARSRSAVQAERQREQVLPSEAEPVRFERPPRAFRGEKQA